MFLPWFSSLLTAQAPLSAAPTISHQQAFFFGGKLGCGQGVFVAYGNDFVYYRPVQNLGHKTRPYALYLVAAASALRQNGRRQRLHRHYFYVGVFFLKIFAASRDCASRAHARHEDVYFALCPAISQRRWFSVYGGLAGLSNWRRIREFGISPFSLSASSIALIPLAAGSKLRPNWLNSLRLSTLMDSGMVNISL